jgi:hypothetical protein
MAHNLARLAQVTSTAGPVTIDRSDNEGIKKKLESDDQIFPLIALLQTEHGPAGRQDGAGENNQMQSERCAMKIPRFSPRYLIASAVLTFMSAGTCAVAQNVWVDASKGFRIGGDPFAFGSEIKQNVSLGFSGNLLMLTTGGGGNTAAGFAALLNNQIGTQNSAFGSNALASNTKGAMNTVAGSYAMASNTTGTGNTANGMFALRNNTTGVYNTVSGYAGLSGNITGSQNTATGSSALNSNTTGGGNTANGNAALSSNVTGYYNTAIGYAAGPDYKSPNLSYATAIGAGAIVSQSNALVLGGTGVYATNVGIGTATPSNILTIAQGSGVAVSDGWTTYSSRRWKTNIHTLVDALGRVEKLRGVSYDLKANGKHEVGVIAEEVAAVVPEIVTWENNGKNAKSVDYTRLTALLIEATKEQQVLIKAQQGILKVQQMQISKLASQVRAVQAVLDANPRTSLAIKKSVLHSSDSKNVFSTHD